MPGGTTVISLVGLVVKLVKWSVITVAYLLVGLAKLVAIVVVLLFMTTRAGVRRLMDAKDRSDGVAEDEYDLGYPSHVGTSMPSLHGVSRDAFDARWQRERDLRVAERRERRARAGTARVVSSRPNGER
jgi:inner membrane protein involved in colicin E2 resistance